MTSGHELFREWSAAYVLGALEPHERVEFERHLHECDLCRDEVQLVAAIPGLLAQIDPTLSGDPEAQPRITAAAVNRAATDLAKLERTGRRWRAAALALTAGAAGLVLTVVVDGGSESRHTPTRLAIEGGGPGEVEVEERGWGTEISVELTGLPTSDVLELWAVDSAGEWTIAATWNALDHGRVAVSGAAAVATPDLAEVVVTSRDRATIVLRARP